MERRYGLGDITQTTLDDGRIQVTVTAHDCYLPEILDQIAHDIRRRELTRMNADTKSRHYSSCAALWLSGSGQGDRCGAPVDSTVSINTPRELPLCNYHVGRFDTWMLGESLRRVRERDEWLAQLRVERRTR